MSHHNLRLPIGPIIMLLRDGQSKWISELVRHHVDLPAIDLHAACNDYEKRTGSVYRVTGGPINGIIYRQRNFMGDVCIYLS